MNQKQEALRQKSLVLLAEWQGRQWLLPVAQDPIGIGRSVNNHVSAADPRLAPRHLRIIPLGEDVWVRDMGSPEGFLWNGKLVREARLQPGDEIVVGELRASLLIEERSVPLPAPDPVVMPEPPEPPPAPVRRTAIPVRGARPWQIIAGTFVALAVVAYAFLQHAESQDEGMGREEALRRIREADEHLKQKDAPKAQAALEGLPREDPVVDLRAQEVERGIAELVRDLKRREELARGQEYYDRYLKPLITSNKLRSDVRWEFIAWRRCEDFLALFPDHPMSPAILTRRNHFAGGAKAPPPAKFSEIEFDVKDLLEGDPPNFAMARSRVIAFQRENAGTSDDLLARDLLEKLDAEAERFLDREIDAVRRAWNGGERKDALAALDRLIREMGRSDLAQKAREAKKLLQGTDR